MKPVSQIHDALSGWFAPWGAGVWVEEIGEGFPLLPEEEAFAIGMVAKRRAEFSAGRHCARQALRQAGGPAVEIPIGDRYAPIWPDDYAGSITHTAGIAAAVAMRCHPRMNQASGVNPEPAELAVRGLGIDLVDLGEARTSLRDAGSFLYSAADIAQARSIVESETDAASLLFSAKECVIKAASAAAGRYLDFTEIGIIVTATGFQGEVLGSKFPGWWIRLGDLLLTGTIWPA